MSTVTLGTLLKDLEAQQAKWETVLATGGTDVDTIIGMMRTLWRGQTSRHGGVTPTVAETPEAAQAAVFLAATLVQWFISVAVERRSASSDESSTRERHLFGASPTCASISSVTAVPHGRRLGVVLLALVPVFLLLTLGLAFTIFGEVAALFAVGSLLAAMIVLSRAKRPR